MKIDKTTVCIRLLCIVTLLWSIATSEATPSKRTLGIGDPAPALQAGSWIQGEPVTEFDQDKAYLIEFWATWCGPCVQSIPRLNEIAAEYESKGLVVIGQNISEPNESKVKPFVEMMGDQMTYRVALDDKSQMEKGAMATTWLKASGAGGIPIAFLVGRDGRIAWIGHPMKLKTQVIEQVLAGTFDIERASISYRRGNELLELEQELQDYYRAGRWDEAEAVLNKTNELFPEKSLDFALLKARIAFQRIANQLENQINAKAWDAADTSVRKISDLILQDSLPDEAKIEFTTAASKGHLMILLGRGDWETAARKLKQLPTTEAIEMVEASIAMSDDKLALEKLRDIKERLRAEMRPEHERAH